MTVQSNTDTLAFLERAHTPRNNIKMDRRWVSCGNQPMCQTMASVVPPVVMSNALELTEARLRADRAWISNQLKRFSGPPMMELRVLDDDEIESFADYYAVLIGLPMPNSNDPAQTFPVRRLGYASAPFYDGSARIESLRTLVFNLMQALAVHEVREWMKFDDEHIVEPHPELN